jgi:predicted ATPase/DNA-binding SARP family transcriptional activator
VAYDSITLMIEVRLLGSIELVVEGEPRPIGSASQRAILAALAMAPATVVSADRLVEVLWGEEPPVSAATTLQVYVSRLRKVLGPDHISTRPPGYALVGVATDVQRFEDLAAAGDIASLAEAMALWRGEPYGELGDREPFHAETTRLRHLRSLVEERRIGALVDSEPARAAAEARALVAADPLSEARWILLAEALAASGRTPEAVRALGEARRSLAEVGLTPSGSLEVLEDRLLAGEGGHGPGAGRGVPVVPPLEMPIGRGELLERLTEMVGVHRVVTVVGPGGVGKTIAAQTVAAGVRARFADGAFWCDLSSHDSGEAVVPAIARALGSSITGSIEETLMEYGRDLNALLVVDNAEHVVGEVARVVRRLLGQASGVSVLVTSREPLRVESERVVPLDPLDPDTDAVELFSARAAAAGVPPTAANLPAVRRICELLDGLPLAIEMAAARLRVMDPATLAERLGSGLAILGPGPRSGGRRHETLTGMVEWSMEVLDADERLVLARATRFAGVFSLDAAEHVVGGSDMDKDEVAGILSRLVDRSLLAPVGRSGGPWFRMLAPVRWVVAGSCPAEDLEEAGRRHADHYAALAEELGVGLVGPDESACATRIETHLPDLGMAVSRSLDTERADPAVRICVALYPMVYHRLRADIAAWSERVFDRAEPDHPGLASVGALAALAAVQRGDIGRAWKLCEQARRVAMKVPGSATYRIAEVEIDLLSYTGQFEGFQERGQEMLRGARAAGDREGELMALISTGLIRAYSGDTEGAATALADMRRLEPGLASPTVSAWVDYVEGEMNLDRDPERAERLLRRAVEATQASGAAFVEGVARLSLASVTARNGPSAAALELFGQTVRHWLDLGDWVHQWVTLRNLAVLLAGLGRQAPSLILLAGAETRERPSYGDEARRLDQVRRQLRESLGDSTFAGLVREAESLGDRQLVDLALAETGG